MVNLRLHGVGIAVPLIGSPIGTADTDKMNAQVTKLLHQLGIRTVIKRPAIGEHAIDPPLEKRRHRPPVDGIDQHKGIGAIDPRLLGGNISGRRFLPVMDSEISRSEPWIERLRREVRDFEGVAGICQGYAFGDLRSEAMGEGLGIVMGNNDKRVNVENSCY